MSITNPFMVIVSRSGSRAGTQTNESRLNLGRFILLYTGPCVDKAEPHPESGQTVTGSSDYPEGYINPDSRC